MENRRSQLGRLELTPFEIVEAFPEYLPLLNRELRRLKSELAPWLNHIEEIKESYLDDFERMFFIETVKLFMPKEEKHLYEKMLKIKELYLRKKRKGTDDLNIDKAKQVKIEDLYSFENIRRTSQRITASCPFHQDKTPSFIINKKNTFKCFSCQSGGSSIDFIMKLNNINFVEAVKYLGGGNG